MYCSLSNVEALLVLTQCTYDTEALAIGTGFEVTISLTLLLM